MLITVQWTPSLDTHHQDKNVDIKCLLERNEFPIVAKALLMDGNKKMICWLYSMQVQGFGFGSCFAF